jgi:hypothetical protein
MSAYFFSAVTGSGASATIGEYFPAPITGHLNGPSVAGRTINAYGPENYSVATCLFGGTLYGSTTTDGSGNFTLPLHNANYYSGGYAINLILFDPIISGGHGDVADPYFITVTNNPFTAGVPHHIRQDSATSQNISAGSPSTPFVATVVDGYNNPVASGIAVQATCNATYGTWETLGTTTQSLTTNSSGQVTTNRFISNGTTGSSAVTLLCPAYGSVDPVGFTVIVGPPPSNPRQVTLAVCEV